MNFVKRLAFWAFTFILGACIAFAFYTLFLATWNISHAMVLVVLFALTFAFALVSRLWIQRFVWPFLNSHSKAARVSLVIGCLLAGLLLVVSLNLHGERGSFVYPRHRLELIPTGEHNPLSQGSKVALHRFADGLTYEFALDVFSAGEAWQVNYGALEWDGVQPDKLTWDGTLMNRGYLYLVTGPSAGIVRLVWDGKEERIDLYAPAASDVVYKLPVNNPFTDFVRVFGQVAFETTLGFILLAVIAGLMKLNYKSQPVVQPQNWWNWLLFSIPMLVGWGFYLAIYFPGILSDDSVIAWNEIANHSYTDWAPAIHTMLESLLTHIWNSPASVAIFQILLLSLITAWGLGMVHRLGLPAWLCWLISGLFAVSPANGTMTITMWKDVIYGVSIFALMLVTLRIITTQGSWLASPGHCILLGIVGVAGSLFRHNGVVVVGVALVTLLVVYKRYWKWLVFTLVGVAVLWAGIRGPFYTLMKVQKNSATLGDTILLHHIGAHIRAGTPLTDDEKVYLNDLRPLGLWNYNGCNVNSLFFVDNFNYLLFEANSAKTLRITIDLALRDPKVEVNHFITSSSMIWKMIQPCFIYYHSIYSLPDGSVSWIKPNQRGLHEQSLLPGWVSGFTKFVAGSADPKVSWWVWGPASYLYISLLAMVVLALRFRDWRYLLVGLPILIQSLVMIAITISTDFRYQYSAHLIGLFSIALLFLQASRPQSKTIKS